MDLQTDLAASPPRLLLAGSLTIAEAAAARADLLAALATLGGLPAGPVQLDLAQLAEADGAGVQLLVAAAHSLRAAGHAPRFGPCNPALRRTAQALGADFGGTR